ncbi:DgyrCDS7659 [Dimorphilus gyrociliatus]|uniref:Lysophospholipid acyltransferase 7 n=1 Tax=Dimorphilus gyrociliatus TaxID=2664684 RepID=A0A7I8VTF5_9ANNE|nr:DgyrCDS7659 [Dimorphilus gyrociliatus]
MSKDDWIYLFLLFLSIPLGFLTAKLPSGVIRKLFSTFVGLLFTVCVCGNETIHSVITVVVNCLIIKVFHKQGLSHIVSFIWCFGYLGIFRTLHLLGVQENPVSGHSNAIQLFITLRDFEQPGWDDYSLLYKMAFMFPAFIVFRTRLYIAWLLGEVMCIASLLGAYPKEAESSSGYGPRNLEKLDKVLSDDKEIIYDFETIRSIDFYLTELAPTVKEGMRGWNMSVQFWLASCVYKRVQFGGYIFGAFITMSVSAFWHGIHPGYYLSFLTIPPNLLSENIMRKALRSKKTERIFDWLCWFCLSLNKQKKHNLE